MSNRKVRANCYIQSGSFLTVRAHIAIEIMSAIAVNAGRNGYTFSDPSFAAADSVRWADALIDELNKEEIKNDHN